TATDGQRTISHERNANTASARGAGAPGAAVGGDRGDPRGRGQGADVLALVGRPRRRRAGAAAGGGGAGAGGDARGDARRRHGGGRRRAGGAAGAAVAVGAG